MRWALSPRVILLAISSANGSHWLLRPDLPNDGGGKPGHEGCSEPGIELVVHFESGSKPSIVPAIEMVVHFESLLGSEPEVEMVVHLERIAHHNR